MKEFKKPDLTAPRYRPEVYSILNKKFFDKFKEKHPKYKEYDNATLKKIIKTFNRTVYQTVIDKRDGVQLPETIGWLFIGRILAGITGASFTTATAYIADISPAEKRAQNFGMIGAAFGLGFIIGPVLGGVLGQFGPRVPFFAAAFLTLLNVIYGYVILHESLKPENRSIIQWKKANPLGALLNIKDHPLVLKLASVLLLIYLAGYATQGTWTYFTIEKFKWSSAEVGYSLGFVGVTIALVQGGLTRMVIPKLGQVKSVFIGLIFNAAGLLAFSLASKGWMMYAIMIPFALGGLAGPALQGIISNQVGPNEQGTLQGSLTSLISLTSIIGPLLMTNLFSYFTSANAPIYFPGAPFLAGAFLALAGLILSVKPLLRMDKIPKH
jgi:DHA1 family tetracycline resistance protein-like MFS transporter